MREFWKCLEKSSQLVPGAATGKCCQQSSRESGTQALDWGDRTYFLFTFTQRLKWGNNICVIKAHDGHYSWILQIKLVFALGKYVHVFFVSVSYVPQNPWPVSMSSVQGWLVSADVTVHPVCRLQVTQSLHIKRQETWPRELTWGWMSSTRSMEGECWVLTTMNEHQI